MLSSILRFGAIAAALAIGAFSYSAHLPSLSFSQSLVVFLGAVALLIAATHENSLDRERRLRLCLRYGSGLLAVVAAAQYLKLAPQPGAELQAGLAALATIILFFLARWTPMDPAAARSLFWQIDEPTHAPIFPPGKLRRLAAALSTIGAVAAIALNKESHACGLALWIASLAGLAAAAWEPSAKKTRPALDGTADWNQHGGPPVSKHTEWVSMLFILAIATVLRTVLLDHYPSLVDPDEGRQGGYADRIWQDGFPDPFGVGWNTFPHLSYMVERIWVAIFGKSLANLRLSSATIGVISIIPMFFWARRWWGNFVALLAAFLLAVNHEAIMWGRTGLNNVHQIFVAGFLLATYARALQRNRAFDWVLFGYAAGLGFHTYHACKLYPLLIAIASVLIISAIPRLLSRSWRGALVGGLAFALIVAPQAVTSYEEWDRVQREGSNRFDLHQLSEAYERSDTVEVRRYLYTHVDATLRILASNWPHSISDPITSVPFLLGLGCMFWRWRDPRNTTCLVFMFGILIIGGMITIYPPWKPRLVGMLPILCVIPAIVIGRLRPLAYAIAGKRSDLVLAPILIVALANVGYANWQSQFVLWPEIHKGRTMTALCNTILNTQGPATVYMAGGMHFPPGRAIGECYSDLPKGVEVLDLVEDAELAPVPPQHHGNAVFIVTPSLDFLIERVKAAYPEATHETVNDKHGPSLHILRVSGRQIQAHHGLTGIAEEIEGIGVTVPPRGNEIAAPASDRPWPRAVWRGVVQIQDAAEYEFRCGDAEIRLDGMKSPRFLAEGLHNIAVEIRAAVPGQRHQLFWRRGNASDNWSLVPSQALFDKPSNDALVRRQYFEPRSLDGAGATQGPPDRASISSAILLEHIREWSDDPRHSMWQPSTTEWIGSVRVAVDSPLELKIIATTPTRVYIGGELFLSVEPAQRTASAVWTRGGHHTLLVRTLRGEQHRKQGAWELQLLWRQPGGPWSESPGYELPENLEQLSLSVANSEPHRTRSEHGELRKAR